MSDVRWEASSDSHLEDDGVAPEKNPLRTNFEGLPGGELKANTSHHNSYTTLGFLNPPPQLPRPLK